MVENKESRKVAQPLLSPNINFFLVSARIQLPTSKYVTIRRKRETHSAQHFSGNLKFERIMLHSRKFDSGVECSSVLFSVSVLLRGNSNSN